MLRRMFPGLPARGQVLELWHDRQWPARMGELACRASPAPRASVVLARWDVRVEQPAVWTCKPDGAENALLDSTGGSLQTAAVERLQAPRANAVSSSGP